MTESEVNVSDELLLRNLKMFDGEYLSRAAILLFHPTPEQYATGVPIQVSVYEDKIVIFNMGSWSKRVPTDERVYEKHESVPNNPKIADVSFRSGDVESWGRGFLKIKAECKTINAPLPIIDAENGGVSVSAVGCKQYMSILRYGQYGQVGADGVWRNKEKECKKTGDKNRR